MMALVLLTPVLPYFAVYVLRRLQFAASTAPVPAGFQRMSLADKLKLLDEANNYLAQVCGT